MKHATAPINANPPDVEDAQTPLMSQKRMDEPTQTIQYITRVQNKREDNITEACFCFTVGVFVCAPCCPLYNVWKYKKLQKKQKEAKENGENFEIDSSFEILAKLSLIFALLLIIWFIVSIIFCIFDDGCFDII